MLITKISAQEDSSGVYLPRIESIGVEREESGNVTPFLLAGAQRSCRRHMQESPE